MIQDFSFTWDAGVILFLLIAGFFYGISFGRKKLALFLISLYAALVLFPRLPGIGAILEGAEEGSVPVLRGVFFGATVLIIFVLLSGSFIRSILPVPKKGDAPWWHILLLSAATSLFLANIVLQFFPREKLAPLLKNIFLFPNAEFFWALAPVLVLALLRRKKKVIK